MWLVWFGLYFEPRARFEGDRLAVSEGGGKKILPSPVRRFLVLTLYLEVLTLP